VGRLPGLGHVVAGGLASQPQRGRHGRLVPRAGRAAGALGDHAAVLDGEVVAVGPEGRPSFEASSSAWPPGAGRRRGAAVTYLAFDLLWLDGRLLEGLALAGDAWRTVAVVPRRGRRPAGRDPRPGLEGVVAKRLHSPYLPGRRTRSWRKVKHYQRETFQVGGYVPDATRPAPCWSAWPTRVGPAAPPCLQRPQPIL
jgi:bifunctional non-homologous end joining protein LigD